MSAYVVAHVSVTDRDRFRQYQRAALPTISASGGRVLAASPSSTLEGDDGPNHNVIIEFPSEDAARSWYESGGYQAAVPIRQESSDASQLLLVVDLDSPGGARRAL